MPIKITLQIDRISNYADQKDQRPVARMISAGTTQSIISIDSTTVESREQAADILQVVVDSLRNKKQ